jgi:hypothetical protein
MPLHLAALSLLLIANNASLAENHRSLPAAETGGVVSMRVNYPLPCIAIPVLEATVILSNADLGEIARAGSRLYQTESERLAYIRALRAEDLLTAAASLKTIHGCSLVSRADVSDSMYLVAELLQDGFAAVVPMNESKPSGRIRFFRSAPDEPQGWSRFFLPGSRAAFLSVMLWIR